LIEDRHHSLLDEFVLCGAARFYATILHKSRMRRRARGALSDERPYRVHWTLRRACGSLRGIADSATRYRLSRTFRRDEQEIDDGSWLTF
jgi:hypothetical protein